MVPARPFSATGAVAQPLPVEFISSATVQPESSTTNEESVPKWNSDVSEHAVDPELTEPDQKGTE